MASFLTGVVFARYILTGCWKNLIDTLSTPLTGRMAGSSRGLAFILGAEGVKEQTQRERDTICLSLDGLRKAAALSCALGNITYHSFHLVYFYYSSLILFPHTVNFCIRSIVVEDGTLMKMVCLLGHLGVAANCASALAQMAAASCVQEEKEEKELGETGDAIAQGIHTYFTLHHSIQSCVMGCTDIILVLHPLLFSDRSYAAYVSYCKLCYI